MMRRRPRSTASRTDASRTATRRAATTAPVLALALLALACADPTAPSTMQPFIDMAAGANHTCAISDDGRAFCWGDDRFGQLGARLNERCRGKRCRNPVPVAGDLMMTDIALGERHTCAIAGRRVYCWGLDRNGQLGSDSTVAQPCQETPAFKCALVPRRSAIGLPMTAVTAGPSHSCALDATGTAFCWGLNLGMQLGTRDTEERLLPVAVQTDLQFETISTGLAHTCGIVAPDAAYCWGNGGSGRLGTGDTEDRAAPTLVGDGTVTRLWQQVDAGGGHTCGVETNGVVSCWGLNNRGQLGIGDRISRARPVPVDIPGRSTQVSAGGSHSCAVAERGNVYCWGDNDRGQLGIGPAGRQLEPVHVPLFARVVHVTAGFAHTCARTAFGNTFCWGANDFGQVGDGTLLDRRTPVRVL